MLPVDAITYYTKDGKVYFAIDKEYLTYIGQAELEMDLPQIIDALLAQYPGLGIEATDDYYAIPLKYGVKDGVTTLKVDKEMMMPYMPLITSLVEAFLPDGDIEVSLDPESDPMKIPARRWSTRCSTRFSTRANPSRSASALRNRTGGDKSLARQVAETPQPAFFFCISCLSEYYFLILLSTT